MEHDAEASQRHEGAWVFKRGLCPDFIKELCKLAHQDSWFKEVLNDPELIVGIRNEYINVYYYGQSLFKACWNITTKTLSISTHPKYLVDPSLSNQVSFDGTKFDISGIDPLASRYKYAETPRRMKRAARPYCSVEKIGVQRIVRANGHVVDLEIAFNKEAEQGVAQDQDAPPLADALQAPGEIDDTLNPRAALRKLDIACFERIDGKIRLCFWEAKDYKNAELWASGDTRPPVARQVSEYKTIVKRYEPDLLTSYRVVAKNLMSIAKMTGRGDKLCPLIKEVAADGTKLVGATPAHVGVVVFGFSSADRNSERHRLMIKKLEDEGLAVRLQGDARGLKLGSAVPQSRPQRA